MKNSSLKAKIIFIKCLLKLKYIQYLIQEKNNTPIQIEYACFLVDGEQDLNQLKDCILQIEVYLILE